MDEMFNNPKAKHYRIPCARSASAAPKGKLVITGPRLTKSETLSCCIPILGLALAGGIQKPEDRLKR